MGQSLQMEAPRLSARQLDCLSQEILDASEHMSDDQILTLADALHDSLRQRRRLRGRVHRRLEDRLHSLDVVALN